MATGTKYLTEAELVDAVKLKIFPNKTKGITGVAHQQAVLDMVASLWGQGVSSDIQDLQSVLDEGTLATNIASSIDITFNDGSNFLVGGAQLGLTWAQGAAISNFDMTPNGLQMQSAQTVGVEASMDVTPGGFLAETDNNNPGDNRIKIEVIRDTMRIGYGGFTIASNTGSAGVFPIDPYDNGTVINPSAMWDIDGDLRVRDIPFSTSEQRPLVADANGKLSEFFPEYEMNSWIFVEKSTGSKRNYTHTSSGSSSITMQLNITGFGEQDVGRWTLASIQQGNGSTLQVTTDDGSFTSGTAGEGGIIVVEVVRVLLSTSPDTYEYRVIEIYS